MFYGYSSYTEFNQILKLVILVITAFFLDVYFIRGIKALISKKNRRLIYKLVIRTNWIVFFLFLSFVLGYFIIRNTDCDNPVRPLYIIWVNTVFILVYFPKILFNVLQLLQDILRLIQFTLEKLLRKKVISNVLFKNIFLKTGALLSVFVFLIIFQGIFWGKYNFKIKQVILEFQNLPTAFDGYKVVQFSDIHFGSFSEYAPFEEAIKLINNLHPDLLLFTGDMVNFKATEAEPWINLFNGLESVDGKFAVLGNHDFGDYVACYNEIQRGEEVSRLLRIQQKMGFENLQNESVNIHKGNDSLALLGVMNWSNPPYKSYGNLEKAYHGNSEALFKILLSHDPHHWEQEVRDNYLIDLTLSGHTHGAQFGIDLPFYRWCPIKWKYKYWGGLYSEKGKFLYVNTGLGLIGFHGRIGMRPEITEIILRKKIY
ncbi:metallophosphoesterase [Bacteroidota bacterium]